jgi:hypothetical protein
MSHDKLLELVRYVLPLEIVDYFDLVDLQESEGTLHLYLDESNVIPDEHNGKLLSSNGFYEASTIKDFPLRDRKVILHVRRRGWVDESGKSHSRQWELVAEGTRYRVLRTQYKYSKDFASFLLVLRTLYK